MHSVLRAMTVVLLFGCTLVGWRADNAPRAAAARAEPRPELGKDLMIYLGCGQVNGPGKVVQLDTAGKVLGGVTLPQTPYGLAAPKEGLLAALPGGQQVMKIDAKGQRTSLLDNAGLPAPIAVAADPKTGDVLVADNLADVLVLLPRGEPKKRRTLLKITGFEQQAQDMSVALTKDGHVLFGSDGPKGVYRFEAKGNPDLDTQLLPDEAGVAADPTSGRWVAALKDKLVVFEEGREQATLPYPNGTSRWHCALAFGTDGSLVMALYRGQGNGYDVVQVDLKTGTFNTLFTWTGERIVCLAVAKKMAWPNTDE